MQANPLRQIRKVNGLTQKQVAIAGGITPQVVLKAEQGLYGLVPPKLLSCVAEIGAISESELESGYANWQAEKRKENRAEILGNLARTNQPMDITSYLQFRSAVADSIMGFCKLFCIHPSQWSRLEKTGGDNEFFVRALKEAELEWLLSYLKQN